MRYARLMFTHSAGGVDRARRLRRDLTPAERKLWRALRKGFPHAKWRRQTPIGPYIVDFLSFPERLVIEVDGRQHSDRVAYDEHRTRYLERLDLRVLRFWNLDVLTNMEGVLTTVALTPTPLPSGRGAPTHATEMPLPEGGGASARPTESPLPDGRGLGEGV